MAEMKWVKLATGFLRDEKLHYILKKYGHDAIVFWTGILSECDNGVLTLDEDIFTEILVMDPQRFNELKKIFTSDKYKLLSFTTDGHLEVVNWVKYQFSESYGRVKKYRASKGSNGLVTSVKRNVTVDTDTDTDLDIDINKYIIDRHKIPPKIEWVKQYCEERKNGIDPQRWYDFYEAKGWLVGKVKMKDWQAAIRTWEKNNKKPVNQNQIDPTQATLARYERM